MILENLADFFAFGRYNFYDRGIEKKLFSEFFGKAGKV